MRYSRILIFIALIAIVACAKDKEAEHVSAQEKIIDTYWAKIDSTLFEKTIKDEIFRIVLVKGDKTQPVEQGSSISFFYMGAILTDKGLDTLQVFDTNIKKVAERLKLSTAEELEICEAVAGGGHFISGLEKGLLQMHKGEKALIIFTSKYGYGDKVMNTIPAYSPIIFEVEMKDVKKQ